MTHNQPIEDKFVCQFCGYNSGLRLRECPECGKIARVNAPLPKEGHFERENKITSDFKNSESFSPVDNALQNFERRIYICEHCAYQTPNSLSECPECGRRKFSVSAVSKETNSHSRQNTNNTFDSERFGKVIQYFGVGFFFIAILVFIGVGPTGKSYPRSSIIAGTGDNLLGSLILILVGIVCIFAGSFLKR